MPTCSAQGLSLPVTENFGFGVFLGLFSFLLGVLCLWGVPGFSGLPVVYKTWVIQVCLLLDTPFGRRSVGSITFVTSGENT